MRTRFCSTLLLVWGCSNDPASHDGNASTEPGTGTGGTSSLANTSAAGRSSTGTSTGAVESQGGATSTTHITGALGGGMSQSLGGSGGTATMLAGATSLGGATSSASASSKGGSYAAGGAVAAGGATSGTSSQGGATASGGASSTASTSGTAIPLANYTRTVTATTLTGLSNASGVTWKPETDTFFVITNGTHVLYEFTSDFKTQLRAITLSNGGTDTEDVVYLGSNRFAVVDEDNAAYAFTLPDGATSVSLSAADVEHYVISAPPTTVNRGFEGITIRPSTSGAGQFIVCQEGGVADTPMRVLFFERHLGGGTYSYAASTLAVTEPWNALTKFGGTVTDLASVAYDAASSTLLVLSQESSRLLRVAPETGVIMDQRLLSGLVQYEGLTLASGGRLVFVSEPNTIEIYQVK